MPPGVPTAAASIHSSSEGLAIEVVLTCMLLATHSCNFRAKNRQKARRVFYKARCCLQGSIRRVKNTSRFFHGNRLKLRMGILCALFIVSMLFPSHSWQRCGCKYECFVSICISQLRLRKQIWESQNAACLAYVLAEWFGLNMDMNKGPNREKTRLASYNKKNWVFCIQSAHKWVGEKKGRLKVGKVAVRLTVV